MVGPVLKEFIVGDRSTNLFHFTGIPCESSIKDPIIFHNKEEAEKAGFKLCVECKKRKGIFSASSPQSGFAPSNNTIGVPKKRPIAKRDFSSSRSTITVAKARNQVKPALSSSERTIKIVKAPHGGK